MKFTKQHLQMMYEDGEIVALQALLVRHVIDWMAERGEDPKPLTQAEQNIGDTAITILAQIEKLMARSLRIN